MHVLRPATIIASLVFACSGGAAESPSDADDTGTNSPSTGAEVGSPDPGTADGPSESGDTGVGDSSDQETEFWLPSPAVFRFAIGTAEELSFSHMLDNPEGIDLTFTGVGDWLVTIDSDARTIYYDGDLNPTAATGLQIRAMAEMLAEDSPLIEVSFVDAAAIPEVEYGLVVESNEGTDSTIAWQTAFLANDGRILSFGTGNHVQDQSNAVRTIDPVSIPGEVSAYDLFPWTQDVSPPVNPGGTNRYVSNYNNHASIYLPPDDGFIWFAHGFFEVSSESWLHGNRPPFVAGESWDAYVDVDRENYASAYNPAVAYCDEIDTGILFGSSDGGYGVNPTELSLLLRNDGDVRPQWRIEITDLANQGVEPLHYARNTAACVGTTFYVGGPGDADLGASDGSNRFYAIDVESQTLIDTLTPYPAAEGEGDHFPQIVYDSRRDRLVFIGKNIRTYSFADDAWTDVTPEDWPRYRFVNGVYHPALDKIFFRGTTEDYSCCRGSELRVPSWSWNGLTFTD